MRASFRVLRSTLLLAAAGTAIGAQRTPTPAPRSPAATSAAPGARKPLNVPEYARWRSIGAVTISDDGTWATWSYTQRNIDDTMFVQCTSAWRREIVGSMTGMSLVGARPTTNGRPS